MRTPNDLNQSRIDLKQHTTLIAVIEMSLSSWLVAGVVPGVERQPLKKLAVDESALVKLLNRWREEAEKAGRKIERVAVAFEAGRDGFWLARWLRARGIEAHVIHASNVAVSCEHRRAKTDRLDNEMLKRAFLGWLRGEREHCKMVDDARHKQRVAAGAFQQQGRDLAQLRRAISVGESRFQIGLYGLKIQRTERHFVAASVQREFGDDATEAGLDGRGIRWPERRQQHKARGLRATRHMGKPVERAAER
jgi:hypothetical protein